MAAHGEDRIPDSAGFVRFYRSRQRVYTALLIFVALTVLSMSAVPALRSRLATRIQALKAAIAGDTGPAVVQVGQSREPVPAEFEKPEPPPSPFGNIPPVDIRKTPDGAIILNPAGSPGSSKATRPRVIPPGPAGEESIVDKSEPEPADAEESGPRYSKGTIEQEAYALLLASNPAIAGLVQGNDPSLSFVSWDAAGRGEDTYWVRLKFQSPGKPEAEYIWQVRLESKLVAPLNYNARTIS